MNTIRDVQKGMREAAAWLEKASQDLTELRSAGTQTPAVDLESIRSMGRRYPIKGHCLTGKSAAFQQRYLTLLAGLLMTEAEQPQGGWLLLQRIASGGGAKCGLEDLVDAAADLTSEQMDSFTDAVRKAGLGEALLLDAMLLTLAAGGSGPAYGYIAGLAELLGCPAERLETLAALAAAVAERDRSRITDIIGACDPHALPPLLPQLTPALGYYLFRPDRETIWLEGDWYTPIPFEAYQKLSEERPSKLVIRNAYCTGYPLELSSGRLNEVTMENCRVQGIEEPYGAIFSAEFVRTVQISGCVFRECATERDRSAISLGDAALLSQIWIRDTVFANIEGRIFLYGRTNMENVAMERIQSTENWFVNYHGCSAVNCTYHDCSEEAGDLPAGFREI